MLNEREQLAKGQSESASKMIPSLIDYISIAYWEEG